jgi:predicted nucleic acid-binding protein
VTYDDERTWRPPTGADGDAIPVPAAAPSATDDVDVDRWFESNTADVDDAPSDNLSPDDDAEPAPPARGRRGRKPRVIVGDPGLAIFVDSSALLALVDRDDSTHAAAVAAYGNLLAEGYKLFTTNYVIAETFDLLSTGVGPDVARRFLRDCKIAIYHADEQDERRARRVVLRQTGPNGLSLTDAVSFVVMERLNVADAFAVDPGFLSNAT